MSEPDLTETATEVVDERTVDRWRITVSGGPSTGAAVTVDRGVIRVGCGRDNELVIQDPRVSRSHLELRVSSGGVTVRDLASKNGTFYAGSRVEEVVLPIDGGCLELGHSTVTISPETAADAPGDLDAALRLRYRLTPRQLDLVHQLRQGLRNQAIAANLGLTCSTVKTYLSHLFDALGVGSRGEAIALIERTSRGVGVSPRAAGPRAPG